MSTVTRQAHLQDRPPLCFVPEQETNGRIGDVCQHNNEVSSRYHKPDPAQEQHFPVLLEHLAVARDAVQQILTTLGQH